MLLSFLPSCLNLRNGPSLGEAKYHDYLNRPFCKVSPEDLKIIMSSNVFSRGNEGFDICNDWAFGYQLNDAQRDAIKAGMKLKKPINESRAYELCTQ